MFKHIYFNSLKIFIREKTTIFWLLIFPMALAIFFKLGFSDLGEAENFEVISVAVVENNENAEQIKIYKSIFGEMSDILETEYMTEEDAKEQLLDGDITAYLYIEDNSLAMMIAENGLEQNILKEIVDKVNEGVSLVMSGKVQPDDIQSALNVENVLNEVSLSGQKQDFVAAWFYTILGMTAMYGSILGLTIIKHTQANQSSKAMRFNLAPISKMRGFGAMFAAAATLHSIIMILVYLYLRYIMNINFGDRQLYIILVSVIGGITGISVGALISVVVKAGEGFKNGICMGVSMLGSYLAGMMDNSMKYKVMESMPAVEYVNPAGIITDSYLKLFYYEDLSYYWSNVINLLAIIAVCMTVTILVLRRQRYDSV